MNITLIGFMGTGKTAVGKRLAKRLGWTFVDVDGRIEERAKLSVPDIFATRGEPVFRRLERRCIAEAVRGQRQVIATGGGAFLDDQNRKLLRASGPVICLTASPRVILARVGKQLSVRPLLAGSHDPLAKIRSLLAHRARVYAQADLTIDTSSLLVEEVVQRLWERLGPWLCKSWQYLQEHMGELSQRYGGKYVVVLDDRVVACGATQLEAYRHGASQLGKREAGVYYIPLPEESLTALTAAAT